MTGLTSPLHIMLILLLALLLFGAKRLPEIGRGIGSGMREFKDSVTGHDSPESAAPQRLPAPTDPATTAAPVRA